MNKLNQCVLTGFKLNEQINIEQTTGSYIEYSFAPIGKVKIGLATLMELMK